MSKPGISFIIQTPSPDLDVDSYEGNKVYIRGAVHSLDDAEDMNILGSVVPYEVLQLVRNAFNSERYRAEILLGETLFKFYRKPSRDLVPAEEEDSKLELHKLRKFGAGSRNITEGGGDNPDLFTPDTISGTYNGEERSIRCIGACLRPDFCLSRNACKLLAQKRARELDQHDETVMQKEINRGAGSRNYGPIDEALATVRPPDIAAQDDDGKAEIDKSLQNRPATITDLQDDYTKCVTDSGYLCPDECNQETQCIRRDDPKRYEAIRNGTEDPHAGLTDEQIFPNVSKICFEPCADLERENKVRAGNSEQYGGLATFCSDCPNKPL